MPASADPDRPRPRPASPTFISYAEFGRRFFEAAVTQQRVQAATAGLAGRAIDVGPVGVGPMGLVKVAARGTVGTPAVARRPDPDHVAFTLTIPIELQLTIEIGIDKNRFRAHVQVPLALTAQAADPLRIVVDIADPSAREVEVELEADGMRASVLKVVAGVEREIKRTVAKQVRTELAKPAVHESRIIDVAAALATLG